MEETDFVAVRAQARVGTLLNGRWHLDRLVGVGGMAAVYAATHRNTKRVAIKILHAEISVDENARQRFLREGYAANQVGHSGAVAADDDGLTEDGVAFLVMELLEGETLEERSARKGGKLEAREVLALMDQALSTLEAAHQKGIVHRDLKPENLFLTRDGVLKVLDFGIARLQESAGSPSQTRGVMGTPSFMAPEQARGRWQDVDARTDLWAIGATMFTLISGRCVHQAETANEALVMAVTERAPSLSTVVAKAHPALVELVDKALAYEREARFQSASEFHEALHAVHAALAGDESLPALAVPASKPSQVQSRTLGPTTERGIATLVPSAQKRRSKTTLTLLTLGGVALLALAVPRLLAGSAKRAPYAEPPSAAAGPEPVVTVKDGAPIGIAVLPSAPSVAPSTDSATPPTAGESPAKSTHSVGARVASGSGTVTGSAPKSRTVKLTLDPFVKRH